MKKPFLLRQLLIDRIPDLKTDKDHLVIMVENGTIWATGVPTSKTDSRKPLSYQQNYNLTLALLDFDGDPEFVQVSILEWLSTHQPDLIDNPEWQKTGFAFEVVVLDEACVDLTIRLRLTERIIAHLSDETKELAPDRYSISTADEPPNAAIHDWFMGGDWPEDMRPKRVKP